MTIVCDQSGSITRNTFSKWCRHFVDRLPQKLDRKYDPIVDGQFCAFILIAFLPFLIQLYIPTLAIIKAKHGAGPSKVFNALTIIECEAHPC